MPIGNTQDVWVHIPTPGDHYSPRTGSAIITVIHQMCRHHTGPSRVIVHRDTMSGYEVGERVEIDFPRTGTPAGWRKAIDRGLGVFTSCRILSGSAYHAPACSIGRDFAGVIFIHNEPSGVEIIAQQCPRARVVLWVQNELFRTYTPRQVRRVIAQSHLVICCSDFIRRGIEHIAGKDAKLLTVLNGVDMELFKPDLKRLQNDIPVILFVGRMVPEKGPDVLLRAVRILKQQGQRFRVRIVGSSGFTSEKPLSQFEKQLRDLSTGLEEVVEFIPFQDRAAIVKQYQQADIFVAPSQWDDPCPLTVLEALSCGLRVIGSERGGIPEQIGQSGIVFSGDANELATAILMGISTSCPAPKNPEQLSWFKRYETVQNKVGR